MPVSSLICLFSGPLERVPCESSRRTRTVHHQAFRKLHHCRLLLDRLLVRASRANPLALGQLGWKRGGNRSCEAEPSTVEIAALTPATLSAEHRAVVLPVKLQVTVSPLAT